MLRMCYYPVLLRDSFISHENNLGTGPNRMTHGSCLRVPFVAVVRFRGFNSTISAVEKAGAWEYALHFFHEMFAAELQQDVSLFNFLLLFQSLDVSENRGTPKSSHLNRVFHYKPSILGYPYFWKHPSVSLENMLFLLFFFVISAASQVLCR